MKTVYTIDMLVDASQPIRSGMPKLPSLPEVTLSAVTSIQDGMQLNISALALATHAGTHVDAPSHIISGGQTIDEVGLERFCGPGAIITVDRSAGEEITIEDLGNHRESLARDDIVLFQTGWAGLFNEPSYFDHPCLSVDLADWLVERGVKMVGIDCCTVDLPIHRREKNFSYPVHRSLLGNGVLIIENLADVSHLSGLKVKVHAFPLPLAGIDAAQARVVVEY